MKHIYFFFTYFVFSLAGNTQTNDLALDTAYHKSGVGGFFEEGLTYSKDVLMILTDDVFLYTYATIRNTGTAAQENCHIIVQTGSHEFSSDTIHLDPGESQTLEIMIDESFYGEIEFKHYPKSDGENSESDNDTLFTSIESSYGQINRSYGEERGIIHTMHDSTGFFTEVGNVYEVNTYYYGLSHIRIPIVDTSSNIDKLIYADVYYYNFETGTWDYYDQSADQHITETTLGDTIELHFSSYVGFEEGDVFLVMLHSDDEFIFATAQQCEENSVIGLNSDLEFEPFNHVIDMEIFLYFSTVPELSKTQLQLKQNYPNPFNQTTTINYTLENSEDLNYIVTDMSGKLIEQKKLGSKNQGEHIIQLETEKWKTGNYLFTLFTSEGKQSITLTKVH